MMRTIYKYELHITDEQQIEMPVGAELLTVAFQNNLQTRLWLWAEVNTEAPTGVRTISIHGTGNPKPVGGVYITTVIGNPFVWHVYDRTDV